MESDTYYRTKYEVHSFVLSLFISSILRQQEEIVVYRYKRQFADCALSELCFPFKICPVMENVLNIDR